MSTTVLLLVLTLPWTESVRPSITLRPLPTLTQELSLLKLWVKLWLVSFISWYRHFHDYIFIPEKPATSSEWQDQMCDIVSKHRSQWGKRTTSCVVAEGAIADLTLISPSDVHKVLVDRLGLDTRITTLGPVQRGGTAVAYDLSGYFTEGLRPLMPFWNPLQTPHHH
nr:BPK_HP1_G0043460.mRNA.1.CDS.1 [Saccharomyces cerevisiae]